MRAERSGSWDEWEREEQWGAPKPAGSTGGRPVPAQQQQGPPPLPQQQQRPAPPAAYSSQQPYQYQAPASTGQRAAAQPFQGVTSAAQPSRPAAQPYTPATPATPQPTNGWAGGGVAYAPRQQQQPAQQQRPAAPQPQQSAPAPQPQPPAWPNIFVPRAPEMQRPSELSVQETQGPHQGQMGQMVPPQQRNHQPSPSLGGGLLGSLASGFGPQVERQLPSNWCHLPARPPFIGHLDWRRGWRRAAPCNPRQARGPAHD